MDHAGITTADTAGSDPLAIARRELEFAEERLLKVERERQHEREYSALLRGELQHRVRNMLAVVRSVFARTVAAGGTADELAEHFRGRLDVIAHYHKGQVVDPEGASDLEMMVRDALKDFRFGGDRRITIAGPPIAIRHEAAQVLGLALHELATNALKFGALDHEAGRLHVSWQTVRDVLVLQWTESNVPAIDVSPARYGFGRDFIEQGLPYQLNAMTSFDLRPGGVLCTIMLPSSASTGSFEGDGT